MTGMPHRPSSTDGQSSVSVLVSTVPASIHPTGLPQKIARRYRSPLSGYATARTVRRLEVL